MNSSGGLSFSDDPCRDSRGDRAGGKIFGNNGTGTDDTAVADGHAGGNDDLGTEPHVVADADVAFVLRLLAEGLAGLLMVAGIFTWLSVPLALFIGSVGAVSVFKAVYVDRRELKCACVGGSSNVPLGFVSLTENLMMVGMAAWMALM